MNPPPTQNGRPVWYLTLLAGICLISTSAILVTLSRVAPTVSAFYRNFLAALLWAALLLFWRPAALSFPRCRRGNQDPAGTTQPRLTPGFLLILLGLAFAADLWAWHRCIFRLGAGPATLLGNLQVIFVSFMAIFLFGERLRQRYWLGALLALGGIALLTLGDRVGNLVLPGILYGLVTAITYSLFLIILKFLDAHRIPAEQILFWVAILSALPLAGMVLIEGRSLFLPLGPSLAWLLLHALLSSVLGWWLIIRAMHRLPVSVTSTLLLLQPVLTTVWGWIFLDQHLAAIQIAGIVTTLAGIRLASLVPLRAGGK